MLKGKQWKVLAGHHKRDAPNLPVAFMQDHIGSELGPSITSPALIYTPETSVFAKPGKKEEIER